MLRLNRDRVSVYQGFQCLTLKESETMKRSEYVRICMRQPASWLLFCLREPSPYQRQRHLTLIRVALRRMGVQS